MKEEIKKDIIELSRGYLGAILLAILMYSGIVTGLYPGETIIESHNLGTDNLIYTIIGNSSKLTILPNVTINSTHVKVYFPTDMPPNNFTIVFIEEQTKEIVKVIHTSGGHSTKYIDKVEIQNQTVYVPEYIEKEIEVEKIVDNTTVIETGYELWHLTLAAILCIAFGWAISNNWREKDG